MQCKHYKVMRIIDEFYMLTYKKISLSTILNKLVLYVTILIFDPLFLFKEFVVPF